MDTVTATSLTARITDKLRERNIVCSAFFAREADRLAMACREMADRFSRGGRLLAFGHGPHATDAQHVAVEFVHPVIVGKRALPALDLSLDFWRWINVILRPQDMVMGFGPPDGGLDIWQALSSARARGAMTFALPGPRGSASYAVEAPTQDAFVHQEIVEMLYHTLWETVHVFLEHRGLGRTDVGEASFLYPFLSQSQSQSQSLAQAPPLTGVVADVAGSIKMKAGDDAKLRDQVAREQAEAIAEAAVAIRDRVQAGGKLIIFGNGGSATDANDWALDCVDPPDGYRPVPAISLALEPAAVTAIANDVGTECVFLRQLIPHAAPQDVAIAISTSGGSRNVIMALEEARKRGLLTVALLGYDGGEILRQQLVDHPIVVRSDYIPRIQEVQASIYHILRDLQEELGRER